MDEKDAETQLELEFDKERQMINATSMMYLQNYIITLRELTIIKDSIVITDKYYIDREYSIKTNAAELIWIWTVHSKKIQDHINNKAQVDIELKRPEIQEFDSEKKNLFLINHYRFEDAILKEKSKDDNLKISGEQRKQ